MKKVLEGKGKFDYDYIHDILLFTIKDRLYDRSIELGDVIIDLDTEENIMGVQIFEVSKQTGISKAHFRDIKKFGFEGVIRKLDENRSLIEVKLDFILLVRNKEIHERPSYTTSVDEKLDESKMVAVAKS